MKNHHLSVGFKLAGHYEIVELLGEDEFEILYLVKDLHLAEKHFVLKELFLPSYASRNEDNSLNIMAKSKQIFEQTKKDIIAEIEVLKTAEEQQSPKVYGYFEENNTLYTIMEFVNDSDISSYLEIDSKNEPEEVMIAEEVIEEEPTEEIKEPIVEHSTQEEEKSKSTLFLKILIVCVVIFLGLAFYTYQMLQEEKQRIKEKSEQTSVTVIKSTTIPHPPLAERDKDKKEKAPSTTPVKELNSSSDETQYIEPPKEEEIESGISDGVPKEEVYQTEDELEEIVANEEEGDVFDEEDTFDEGTFDEGGFEENGFETTPNTINETTNSLLGRRIN